VFIIKSELEPNYGVSDAVCHNSYELASELRLNAARRTMSLGLPSEWMSRPFITQRHIQMSGSVSGQCQQFLVYLSLFLLLCLFLALLQAAVHQPVGILEVKSW